MVEYFVCVIFFQILWLVEKMGVFFKFYGGLFLREMLGRYA